MTRSATLGLDDALLCELLQELGEEASTHRFEVAQQMSCGCRGMGSSREQRLCPVKAGHQLCLTGVYQMCPGHG